MDFFNKAIAQLTDLFRSMTPAARITAALLLLVIVISVAYLFNHQFAGADGYLFGGEPVAPSQLPAMEAAFGKKNLSDYELEGNRIRVPQGKQAAYMAALADAGALPHNFLDSLTKSLDSGGPFVDRRKREELVKVALQDELSKIIGQMSGIERATVLYNVEPPQAFNSKKLVTASVTVKPTGSQMLNSEQVQMIRLAVGPAIGAAPESVAVVDVNGHAYPGGEPGSIVDATQDRYLNTKLEYERKYADNIRQTLSFVKGVVVTVNAELHPELEETETSNKIDPKAVAYEVSESNKTSNSNTSLPSGRPGVGNQGGVNAPAAVGAGGNGSRTEDESTTRHERNMISNESRQVSKAGLTPKRVTVSVGIPSSYYEEVWQQRNPVPTGATPKKPEAAAISQIETEENTKIKKSVIGIIPAPEDSSSDPVIVTSFTSMPVPEIEKPSTADHALVWFTEHASALGMALLGIFSLLLVRSIVRSVPASVTDESKELMHTSTATTSTEEAPEEVPTQVAAVPRLRRRRSKSGPSLRDELVEIVREDPDAAANILRNWIGTAN
ncbi:MAG TPA: flagellar M-ring protein FliF C-terminal domain-containing protein [Pirellulales bacterium]|nr:flagellar M-ring protein FliF C-terminal domain-containing protein [Pirellulales bacterium]